MLAMECASQGDDASAVQHFFEIFALAPNYPPAYHQAGRALQRLNRLTEARGPGARHRRRPGQARRPHGPGDA